MVDIFEVINKLIEDTKKGKRWLNNPNSDGYITSINQFVSVHCFTSKKEPYSYYLRFKFGDKVYESWEFVPNIFNDNKLSEKLENSKKVLYETIKYGVEYIPIENHLEAYLKLENN